MMSLTRPALLVTLLLILVFALPKTADAQTEQNRFNFVLHDTLTTADVAHLERALQSNYERIKDQLQVASLPTIKVQIWSDETLYQDAMEETLGSRFPGSRGYVTGDTEMRLLYHRRLSAQKEAVHEFAHVVSLNLHPEFGNNPRWLWEAVALYSAGELREPAEVDYMRNREFPTLEELSAGFNASKNIYDVGYLLVDYITTQWGQDALIDLIRANGDIPSVLDVSVDAFEKGWHQFVVDKHLTP